MTSSKSSLKIVAKAPAKKPANPAIQVLKTKRGGVHKKSTSAERAALKLALKKTPLLPEA